MSCTCNGNGEHICIVYGSEPCPLCSSHAEIELEIEKNRAMLAELFVMRESLEASNEQRDDALTQLAHLQAIEKDIKTAFVKLLPELKIQKIGTKFEGGQYKNEARFDAPEKMFLPKWVTLSDLLYASHCEAVRKFGGYLNERLLGYKLELGDIDKCVGDYFTRIKEQG